MTNNLQNFIDESEHEMNKISEYCLDLCKNLGCEEAQVTTSIHAEKRLVTESGEFTMANTITSRELTLTIHKNHKKGSIKTNIFSPDHLEKITQNALTLAQFSLPDPFLNFATPAMTASASELKFLFDPATVELSFDDLKHTKQAMLDIVKANTKVALDHTEIAAEISHQTIRNSHGLSQKEKTADVSWSLSGLAREEDEVSGFDYDDGFSYKAADFHQKAVAETRIFVDRLAANLNPIKCPRYKGPVLLSPRAIESLLLEVWFYHMGGAQIMDGKSRWHKALGTRVISDKITMYDHPHDPTLGGSTSFDMDGIATQSLPLIQNGILCTHLHDCYSAKKLNVPPNGTAGGPFSLHIANGDSTLVSLIESEKKILFVDRFSGNCDPLTGDFSGVAKSSRIYQKGKEPRAVVETMIAGNIFEISENIIALSHQAESVSGQFYAPHILIDGMTVS